jgi:hypothetical protein
MEHETPVTAVPQRFRTWIPLALMIVALLACYASTLSGMVQQWWSDEDMGHGFLVPILVLWIVWKDRKRVISEPSAPSAWGFAIFAVAAALQMCKYPTNTA